VGLQIWQQRLGNLVVGVLIQLRAALG